MTVGLTLADHSIAVVFRDDGVFTLLPTQPALIGALEIDQHLETLQLLGVRLIAERESLTDRQLSQLKWEVERLDRREVIQLLGESDAITCF
jgi:sulfur relay (sulfurtransferase) DsrF/TusC family protein